MYDEENVDVAGLVTRLLSNGHELEWVEFKQNNSDPAEIGQYISALANSAALHGENAGFMIWGIDDATAAVVGTTFSPKTAKRGNQLLEIWLAHALNPRVDFRFREENIDGKHVVVLQVPSASTAPVSFEGEEYIRIGSSKTKLRGHFEKERKLWLRFSRRSFEDDIALGGVSADEVVRLLACEAYFDLAGLPVPGSSGAICDRMVDEGVIRRNAGGYDITNLGAIAFARQLKPLGLERKAVRLILYTGEARYDSSKEFVSAEGYASGFKRLLETMDALLPSNEVIEKALRTQVTLYPPLAVRELVANALIHQDFLLTGTGPVIEVFDGRMEISNPGRPLIDPQRFLDATPRSRNEKLAALLRRLGICEERGSGIDKVVRQAEVYQLPPPDFRMSDEHTVTVLYAPRPFPQMDRTERIRACYQHAGLQFIARKYLTNSSLRDRFGIDVKNSAMASRIINETLEAGLIKADDLDNRSRKHARYVPYWA
ncbi:ATP-binding protein [Longimicrobium sp.]|uniref:ATP-binding protein n=1 Tax=Longimicrobium sp. TaxID=2029185 RepID=UPI002E310FE0|nr:ATP-binding protein [Longimicrobium sp.]HEX6042641.1 ATP-binding protein [Longimicrobium sp.]